MEATLTDRRPHRGLTDLTRPGVERRLPRREGAVRKTSGVGRIRRVGEAWVLEAVREGAIALPELGGVVLLDDLYYLADGG